MEPHRVDVSSVGKQQKFRKGRRKGGKKGKEKKKGKISFE